MAKTNTSNLQQQIEQIIAGAARQIADAAQAEIKEQVRAIVGGSAAPAPARKAPGRKPGPKPGAKRGRKPAAAAAPVAAPEAAPAKKRGRKPAAAAVETPSAAAAAPAAPASKKAGGKRGAGNAAILDAVLDAIRGNPSLHSEQIEKLTNLPKGKVKGALAKLREAGKVTTVGQARGTMYTAA